MFKSPPKQSAPQDPQRISKYPFLGAVIGLFSLNSRLSVAHADLESSELHRSELINQMDHRIVQGEQVNQQTRNRLAETDQLIIESQKLRQGMK